MDYRTHRYQASGTAFYVPDTPVGFNDTSFEVGTAYQFDANHMAYARFAQGYESGGFAGFATGNSYQPEYNNAYEFGLKGDFEKGTALRNHARAAAPARDEDSPCYIPIPID